MLNLADLEAACAPIKMVGYKELTFTIEGQSITLCPLLPDWEVEAQEYSNAIIEEAKDKDGNVDNAQALNYFDTFRREVLAHSVCQINDLNLRDVEYVATGQTTSGGQQVRVKRHVAMRKIIQGWSRTMISHAFAQYGELMARIEAGSENLVEWEPADLEAELKRAKERVETLETMMEGRAKGDPNLMSEQVKKINEFADANAKVNQAIMRGQPPEAPTEVDVQADPTPYPYFVEQEEPEPPPAAPAALAEPEEEWADFDEVPSAAQLSPKPRQPVYPPAAPPPTGNPAPPQAVRHAPVAYQPQAEPDLPVSPLSGPIDPNAMDSFGDVDDEATLLAEQQRILEARRRMAMERNGATPPRQAPHMRGRRGEPGVSGPGMRMASPEELARMGIDTSMVDPSRIEGDGITRPVEELSRRGRGRAPTELPMVNPNTTPTQSVNPNFVKRKG